MERAGSLQPLYDQREYVLAIYLAGVAVESMFRAYRGRFDPEFSSRHDLYELAKESRFASHVPDSLFAKYAADLGVVAARWSNSHRYRSEIALRKYIKRVKLDRGVKGDALKENARRIINSAFELVTLGAQIWKN
ncbi:MAG TPA: hypothetical protein VFW23_03320 [Tepidisphaeraceae bacterium]|nr:hypothetical protein [Tepidisphaeraceae bacterium]